jgi:hypothetical protein
MSTKHVLEPGDYVLATKYSDGDPCDHFAIGFFSGMIGDRYIIIDGDGQPFRANGFRRCERIDIETGKILLSIFPIIGDRPGNSLWWWLENTDKAKQLASMIGGN